jgi:hypothetical protein
MERELDWIPPYISDTNGHSIVGDWGSCYCTTGIDEGCGCGNGVPSGCDHECLSDKEIDCVGVCGGSAVFDCAGCLSGSAVIDCADVCSGPGIVNTAGDGECCATGAIDCANICDGSAEVDECGTCGGSITDAAQCPTAAIQISSNLPDEFSILQNFPNPFNPVTSIIFDVAEMDNISLLVYDLTGNKIATLVSGTYAPGKYQVNWNAVNNTGDGIPIYLILARGIGT